MGNRKPFLRSAGMSQRALAACLLALLLTGFLPAMEKEPLEVYQQRRQALAKALDNGITVLFAYTERETGDALWGFRQEDNFYYLTGVAEPGAIVMLVPPMRDASAPQYAQSQKFPREILFLPPHNFTQERWTGPKLGPYDPNAKASTGFDAVLGTEVFEQELRRMLAAHSVIYTLLPQARGGERSFEAEQAERLKMLAPFASLRDARLELARLRMVKSKTEQGFIEKAVACSMEAHREAIKAVRPGVFEYQVAALMKYTFERAACLRPAYAPIVGSGFNSTVLHYSENERKMEAGDLVVLDVAGEYSGYAADITRTLPVSGKFTPRQREIYEVVLGAQKAAIAAIKPGMTMGRGGENSIHRIAFEYLNTHGKDSHGQPLGKYFIHGLGHHVGLSVHDAGDPARPLAPGMIVTVEPGLYIPEEKLGVRIEDMVLVTENGARLLTELLPREPDEIERVMAAGRAAGPNQPAGAGRPE